MSNTVGKLELICANVILIPITRKKSLHSGRYLCHFLLTCFLHCITNLKQTHVDLRWDLHTRISDVKARLTKHCGTPSGDMRLILRDDGRDIICMEDDDDFTKFFFK